MSSFSFDNSSLIANLIASVFLITIVLIGKYSTIHLFSTWKLDDKDAKRRWVVHTRNLSLFLLLLGLTIIWASEIRTLAFSIVAVAAALVIGTKEILSCFLGGILKVSNRLFEVGDRIEIAGQRGDVLDHTFLVTTIYEVGHQGTTEKYTGRTIKIPNSLFLTNALINETNSDRYGLFTIRVIIAGGSGWQKAEQLLLKIANEETQQYLKPVRSTLSRIERREGFEVPGAQPKVFISTTERGGVLLHLRVPIRYEYKGKVEQAILRRFAEAFYEPTSELRPSE